MDRADTNGTADLPELQDGIHGMVPEERMPEHVRKFRRTFAITPGLGFYQKEFGYYTLERWAKEGMPQDVDKAELFGFEPEAEYRIRGLGWTEPNYVPRFEEKRIEDRGETEVVQDVFGRHVLYFKGRRSGFMPSYLDHPVKDLLTFERDIRWRIDPNTPERVEDAMV